MDLSFVLNNHGRHFIKIPFINEGMEFIDLNNIVKDKSVPFPLFLVALIIQKLLSFAINITNILFLRKFMINVTILILKLSISHF